MRVENQSQKTSQPVETEPEENQDTRAQLKPSRKKNQSGKKWIWTRSEQSARKLLLYADRTPNMEIHKLPTKPASDLHTK
jgi:hypothetical protein